MKSTLTSAIVTLGIALAPGAAAQTGDDAALVRAKQIIGGSCFLCHGPEGQSATELYPRLAAQNAEYIAKQLANFKSGERRSGTMQPMVRELSEPDMRALGLYFSRQTSPPHAVEDPALAARGREVYERGGGATEVAACLGCHGDRGHGTAALPRLAGQVADYIEQQLRNFGQRVRTNDNEVMHTIAARMTEEERKAVAAYLASLP